MESASRLTVRTGSATCWPSIIPVEVIGVVEDVKATGIRDAAGPQAYFPATQDINNWFYPTQIVVKTRVSPESALAAIRSSLQQLDSSISLFNVRTMNQVVAQNMEDTSLQSALLGIFAGLALVLAAVGVYGVMAYLVTHRTHEIGIRIALGAQPKQVLSLVMRHGGRLAAVGVAIGTVAALMMTRLMSSLLFGVAPTDAATFATAIVFLVIIALLACCIPAWRAMHVDPMVALRNE